MERKAKVKLTAGDLITFFVLYECCGERAIARRVTLMDEEVDGISCDKCGEPKLVKAPNGLWYYVGNRVFE